MVDADLGSGNPCGSAAAQCGKIDLLYGQSSLAAPPPRSAVRLRLTVESLKLLGGSASIFEAQPQKEYRSERRKGAAFPHCAAAEPRGVFLLNRYAPGSKR